MDADSLVSTTRTYGTRRYMNKFLLTFLQTFRYVLAAASFVVFVLVLVENTGFGGSLLALIAVSLVIAGIQTYRSRQ